MSSPRSFYSMASQQGQASAQIPGLPQTPSQQSTLSNLEDVDAWLSHPENVAMLQNIAEKAAQNKASSSKSSNTGQPPMMGVENPSKSIAELHSACQKKGITPDFHLQEPSNQRFTGELRIGDETVVLSVGMRSKKDAKAWLAEQALPILEKVETAGKGPQGNEINWIGKLLEFCNSLAVPPDVNYDIESTDAQKFTCTLTISPSPINGMPWILSTSTPLASKKAAKFSTAEQAVATLIAAGKLSSDGTMIRPQPRLEDLAAQSVGSRPTESASQKSESYAFRAAALCAVLGLNPPVYRLAAADLANAPSLISGAAYLSGHPVRINGVLSPEGGPIGEVRHIHGKKAAKEECAKGVVEYLEKLRIDRLKSMGLGQP